MLRSVVRNRFEKGCTRNLSLENDFQGKQELGSLLTWHLLISCFYDKTLLEPLCCFMFTYSMPVKRCQYLTFKQEKGAGRSSTIKYQSIWVYSANFSTSLLRMASGGTWGLHCSSPRNPFCVLMFPRAKTFRDTRPVPG